VRCSLAALCQNTPPGSGETRRSGNVGPAGPAGLRTASRCRAVRLPGIDRPADAAAIRSPPRYKRSAWHYALARRASGGLRGKLDDRVVWEQEKYNFRPDPAAAYILMKLP
jgi:hypothetical protein